MSVRGARPMAEKATLYIGAFVVLLMIMHIIADITTRQVLNSPIEGTYEITIHWYMVAITAIGLWAAAVKNDHISVTILSDRLEGGAARVWRVCANLITVAALLLLAWCGLEIAMARMASGEYTGAAEMPIWQARFFLPLGFVAFAAVVMVRIVTDLRGNSAPLEQETGDNSG